ncbi:MAG TPA: glycosyltransferase family 2 protein [Anaerolineae bacterium]|nr:glycosyltransferase family 2 protein [Anaerolineae bacterium]
MLDLAVIVVSYNVRDFLRDCLASVLVSGGGLAFETCVVDNGSTDGSAEMVASEFPAVRLVRAENRGYAAGNNLGLRAYGFGTQTPAARYALLLNPDTLIAPHALADLLAFLEARPQAGIAGPRLVREDGSLDKACRRGFPTPEVAFYRMSGLSSLFPKSRRFGRYNLTYLSPNLTTEVDSVVGACMLIRGQVLADVGLLDEQYFMYAEDLDLCYRAKERGWQVWYNAAVTVLHYKGQSSRQRSTFANVQFYKTMRLFHDKHFKARSSALTNGLIHASIGLLGGLAILRDWLRPAERRGVASAVPLDGRSAQR